MIILFDTAEFNSKSANDKLPLECEICKKTFYIDKRYISYEMTANRGKHKYCSIECHSKAKITKVEVTCIQCGKSIYKTKAVYNKSRSKKFFCNSSCSAIYSNSHKTIGCRRSKLEIWVEKELTKKYPSIDMLFNSKHIINSELDIYIPSLKLAFELNGIFHYKPIYGNDKFVKIINNDKYKKQLCANNRIKLHVIDTGKQKHFSEISSKQYLDTITKIIDSSIK